MVSEDTVIEVIEFMVSKADSLTEEKGLYSSARVAEELGCSSSKAAEALRVLRNDGLVETVRGRGYRWTGELRLDGRRLSTDGQVVRHMFRLARLRLHGRGLMEYPTMYSFAHVVKGLTDLERKDEASELRRAYAAL